MKPENIGKKKLPYQEDAEQEVLGCMLLNADVASSIQELLSTDDFQHDMHKEVFKAIERATAGGGIATPAVVKATVKNSEAFKKSGQGDDYIEHLAADWRMLSAATDNAKLVKNLSLKRQMIALGLSMSEDGYSMDKDAVEQIAEAEERLFRLSTQGNVEGNNLKLLESFVKQGIERIKTSVGKGFTGFAIGLQALDQKCGGFSPSDLIVIAGRPGMGKTALAIHIAMHISQQHKKKNLRETTAPVVFFSLEMSGEQIGTRIISDKAGIPAIKVRRGEITRNDVENKLVPALAQLIDIPFHIDDTAGLTIGKLRSRARRLKQREGIGVVIVDYLQLLKSDTRNRWNENRVEELSHITRELKTMAKDLNVLVIALSQLSRAVEQRDDKRPQLSDLRESGSIEQDADMVIFLYREAYYLSQREPKDGTDEHDKWQEKMTAVEKKASLIIGKNRHGETGSVRVIFEPSTTRFGNAPDAPLSKEKILEETKSGAI